MQTAESGSWKVLLPFQRAEKCKWDKWEFKGREVHREKGWEKTENDVIWKIANQ